MRYPGLIGALTSVMVLTLASYGQSTTQPSPPPSAASSSATFNDDSGRFGMGVKFSTLGGGFEAAVRVTHLTNVRAGLNFFSYGRGFNKDGIPYQGRLDFKTFEAHYDIFPFAGGFHFSPGVLAYLTDPITATTAIPGGQSFTLGGAQYFSDTIVPVTGNGKVTFNRVAPTITVGWGNLVPRNASKHFSVPFEVGIAIQGSPKSTLNLAGNVCDSPGFNCRSVASDAIVQAQIHSEETKINNSMSVFKVYPIISIGVGYKF